jgi:uncharacterized protein (DUF4415 family)
MRIMTKSGRWLELPTPEEDIQINAGIAADPDARELDADWFKRAKPAREFFPPEVFAELVAMKRARGRPPLETPKIATAIRFDADVLAGLRATGKGWQTRVNDAMRQWLAQNQADFLK